MARESFKLITLDGYEFKIEKFNALTGSSILFSILQKALPGMLESQGDLDLPAGRAGMDRESFTRIQLDCLESVYIKKAAGFMPVIGFDGLLCDELRTETLLIVTLTVHALRFNLESFFSEDGKSMLKSALEGLPLSFADVLT